MEKKTKNIKVSELVRMLESGKLIIPTYQTGDRWKDSKRIEFCQSILAGYPIAPIVVAHCGDSLHLFDGQQRTKALQRALSGVLGFSETEMTTIRNFKLQIDTITGANETQLRQYFALYNSGIALNASEIRKNQLSVDDLAGFSELEAHTFFDVLVNAKECGKDRESRKDLILQSLICFMSDETCSEDLGKKGLDSIVERLANRQIPTKDLFLFVECFDFVVESLIYREAWMKKNVWPLILKLAREALEQGDSPSVFGGFLQSFFTGKVTVMTGKKGNIPASANELWEGIAKSGTTKPNNVAQRWDILFNAYCDSDLSTFEYKKPKVVADAELRAARKAQKEREKAQFEAWKQREVLQAQKEKAQKEADDAEMAEFRAWKAEREAMKQAMKDMETDLTENMLEV